MTERAKGIMGVGGISVVADKGYYDGEDIDRCERGGTTCYVPAIDTYAHAPDEKYNKKHFRYDAGKDCYVCPEGKELPFRRLENHKGGRHHNRLYYDTRACKACPSRGKCTTNKNIGRTITRSPFEDALDANNARMRTDEARLVFRERKKIVEHPFGTTKKIWGYNQFLCRGRGRATAEQSLTFLAYNFRRVFNIFRENGERMMDRIA
jgi:hypothetical protein